MWPSPINPTRIGVLTNEEPIGTLRWRWSSGSVSRPRSTAWAGSSARRLAGWPQPPTDAIVVCDLKNNTAQRIDLSLTEVTHLAIHPESYGLGLVQERDRIGRATLSGRWIWKAELDSPVEDLAISLDGCTGATTEDGRFRVFDPAGIAVLAGFQGPAGDPALLVGCPARRPGRLADLAPAGRRSSGGMTRLGQVVWSANLPWEGWQLQVVGNQDRG